MKPITLLQAPLLLGLASADFWVYRYREAVSGLPNQDGWQVHSSDPPSCDKLYTWLFKDSDDVSDTKTGARCVAYDGSGCEIGSDPSDIDILELNLHGVNPVYHYTIYKDVGYPLMGVDNVVYGHCEPAAVSGEPEFECRNGGRVDIAKLKFRCTGVNGHVLPSADDINRAAAKDNSPLNMNHVVDLNPDDPYAPYNGGMGLRRRSRPLGGVGLRRRSSPLGEDTNPNSGDCSWWESISAC